MKLVIILTLVISVAAAIFSGGQERGMKTEDLVKQLDAKLTAALLEGDLASVEAILADDYTETNAQGLVRHKPEIMATVRARASAPRSESVGPEVTIDEISFRSHGNSAILVGRASTRYQFMVYQTSPETPQPAVPENIEHERFMKVYSKLNGRWQLVASQRTAIAKR